MKAITICQPYAELIVCGQKCVENRVWATAYRGPLLVHAGRSKAWLDSYRGELPKRMAFGAIIGMAKLVACVRYAHVRQDWAYSWVKTDAHAEGPICWILDDVERLERPIPWRGMPRLFDVPEDELEVFNPYWMPAGPPAQQCRVCGCTEHAPCAEGCHWVEEDLCSACIDPV